MPSLTAASVMVMWSPSVVVSSWMMTASAPSGMTPPVKIRTASPRAHLPLERPAGGDLADHLQPRREIGGVSRAHGIAVHRRHRLRRLGAQCRDIARQHAMIGARRARPSPRATARRRQGSRQAHRQPASEPRQNPSNSQRGKRRRDVIRRSHMHGAQAPRPRAFDILGGIVEEHDARGGHADRFHDMIIGRGFGFPKPDRRRQDRSRGNGRARRHKPAKNARHARRWCWRRHTSGSRVPARASSAAMPGISPAKIAFHPSRNCVSVMSIPSEARRLSKKAASLISPRSCRRQASSGENRPTRCAGSQPAWPAQRPPPC